MSCGVGCTCGSGPMGPWLWCRPAAAALIRHLAWELLYTVGAALKRQKKKKKKKDEFFFFWLWLQHVEVLWAGVESMSQQQHEHYSDNARSLICCVTRELQKYIFFFLSIFFFRAIPSTYGSSWVGVESKLQLPVYTAATETQDPSHICDLDCSFRQCQILNPLSKARDRIHPHRY